MKTVTDFPHAIRRIDDVRIPATDGLELSARIWLPEGAEDRPVPAILEYQPYRQRDLESHEDSITQAYFAGHGYACIRCDLRGSGESDGVLTDEYLESELSDGEAVIAWIAGQPWCDGNVGMFGMSWSGFNALQVAARQPPALKTIITCCSTDDRYSDDIHYMGGCLLGDNLSWAANMLAFNSIPPDPAAVGDRWRDMWLDRLEHGGLWLETWLRHPRRDDYWKHGSVCEDPGAIRVPVFAVSGWADGYSSAVFRLMRDLDVPRKGLVGPWSHRYPHFGQAGNAIGFLQECLRWWAEWLRGEETGVMDEPMLRVFVQHHNAPSTTYAPKSGRWVAEDAWPSEHVRTRELVLGPGTLVAPHSNKGDVGTEARQVRSPLHVGQLAGKWLAYSATPDSPGDQRAEDGGSLVFETAPLEQPVDVVGAPVAVLDLSADRAVAQVAARLCDVPPAGPVTRVSLGLLNLTHRDGHEHPEPLEPGKRYRVRVPMGHCAQRFEAGHRIRLSLSSSYWPLVWPPPEPVTLTVHTGASTLELPLRPPRDEDDALRPFEEAEGAPPITTVELDPPEHRCFLERELATDETAYHRIKDEGRSHIRDLDVVTRSRAVEKYVHVGEDFESIRGEVEWVREFQRGDWHVRTVCRTVQTCTAEAFRVVATVHAYEGDREVYSRAWDREIPRRLV